MFTELFFFFNYAALIKEAARDEAGFTIYQVIKTYSNET